MLNNLDCHFKSWKTLECPCPLSPKENSKCVWAGDSIADPFMRSL